MLIVIITMAYLIEVSWFTVMLKSVYQWDHKRVKWKGLVYLDERQGGICLKRWMWYCSARESRARGDEKWAKVYKLTEKAMSGHKSLCSRSQRYKYSTAITTISPWNQCWSHVQLEAYVKKSHWDHWITVPYCDTRKSNSISTYTTPFMVELITNVQCDCLNSGLDY